MIQIINNQRDENQKNNERTSHTTETRKYEKKKTRTSISNMDAGRKGFTFSVAKNADWYILIEKNNMNILQ